jgi:elongator complex protein 3
LFFVPAVILLDPTIAALPMNQRSVLAIGEIIQELLHENNSRKLERPENIAKRKTRISAKYGLDSSPRLTDIIAAVPIEHRKFLLPKLKAKPVRTASGVSAGLHFLIGTSSV